MFEHVRLRVLTYNIHSGTDILGRQRLVEQAALIRDQRIDLVLLQEVAGQAQAKQFGREAGLSHMEFGPTRSAGAFGNAILSRWPLTQVRNDVVARGRRLSEERAVLSAT